MRLLSIESGFSDTAPENTQAGRVTDGKDDARFQRLDCFEEAGNIGTAEDHGKRFRLTARRDDLTDVPVAFQRDAVEEAERGDGHANGARGRSSVR